MSMGNVKSMSSEVHDYMFRKIVSCEYLPGQELNEKMIMEETGFGRTPLHEALKALHREGLVEIFPRRGLRISPLTERRVNDLYQVRKLLEPTVIEEYKTLYSKETLLSFQHRFREAYELEHLCRFTLDSEFHGYLISITGNEILMDMYRALMVNQTRLAMYAVLLESPDPREADLAQHDNIIDALLRENGQDIRDAVIFHLNHSMARSLHAIRHEA